MKDTTTILHKKILLKLEEYQGKGTTHSGNARYLGTPHFSYRISNPITRKIAKEFVTNHQKISSQDFIALLNRLYQGKSHDEKKVAGMLISYFKKHREKITPDLINRWLTYLEGWAEIDSLCQSIIKAPEMLEQWKLWEKNLTKFSHHRAIAHRRAALALLTGPIKESADKKLFKKALENINTLKSEKDILITKAISWLLRSAVTHHKEKIWHYIKENSNSLPRIAIRETRRKILTGRK